MELRIEPLERQYVQRELGRFFRRIGSCYVESDLYGIRGRRACRIFRCCLVRMGARQFREQVAARGAVHLYRISRRKIMLNLLASAPFLGMIVKLEELLP